MKPRHTNTNIGKWVIWKTDLNLVSSLSQLLHVPPWSVDLFLSLSNCSTFAVAAWGQAVSQRVDALDSFFTDLQVTQELIELLLENLMSFKKRWQRIFKSQSTRHDSTRLYHVVITLLVKGDDYASEWGRLTRGTPIGGISETLRALFENRNRHSALTCLGRHPHCISTFKTLFKSL